MAHHVAHLELKRGQIVQGEQVKEFQFEVVKKLGQGLCANVYEVKSIIKGTERIMAMKIEKFPNSGSLDKDIPVLEALKYTECVPNMLYKDKYRDHQYIVMHNAGENLFDFRNRVGEGKPKSHEKKLNVDVVMALGACLLQDIECMHKEGYLHRDIKSANILIDCNTQYNCIFARLVDMGLAKKYMDSFGKHYESRSARPEKFRGTTTFASINALQGKDLSRRDDLWSLFYVLVECLCGTLPWRKVKGDKSQVLKMKEAGKDGAFYTELNDNKALPEPLLKMLKICQNLRFDEPPNYGEMIKSFSSSSTKISNTVFETHGRKVSKFCYPPLENNLESKTNSVEGIQSHTHQIGNERGRQTPDVKKQQSHFSHMPQSQREAFPLANNSYLPPSKIVVPCPGVALGYMIGTGGAKINQFASHFRVKINKFMDDGSGSGQPCFVISNGMLNDMESAKIAMEREIDRFMNDPTKIKSRISVNSIPIAHANAFQPIPSHQDDYERKRGGDHWNNGNNNRWQMGNVRDSHDMPAEKKVKIEYEGGNGNIPLKSDIKTEKALEESKTGIVKPETRPNTPVMKVPNLSFDLNIKRKLDAEEKMCREGKKMLRMKREVRELSQLDQYAIAKDVINTLSSQGPKMKRFLLELYVTLEKRLRE